MRRGGASPDTVGAVSSPVQSAKKTGQTRAAEETIRSDEAAKADGNCQAAHRLAPINALRFKFIMGVSTHVIKWAMREWTLKCN
jgi:hypothetical protein